VVIDSLMKIMLNESVMLSLIFIPAILLLVFGYVLIIRPLREMKKPDPSTEQPATPKTTRARTRGKKSPFHSRLTRE
jgi:hypothetical protein